MKVGWVQLLVVFTGKVGFSFVVETERHKIMTSSAFVLCAKMLVKLMRGGECQRGEGV